MFYLACMHPVRRALNQWKAESPGSTDQDFAAFVGYADADAIYKQIRGEYIAPHDRIERMAAVLGWSAGRFLDACKRSNQKLNEKSLAVAQ